MSKEAGALDGDRQAFLSARSVSRETLEALDQYAALLRKWQPAINLVGPKTLDVLWTRHFLDSFQLVDYLGAARRIVDLGSGAGFPGLIIALAMRQRPGAHVTLVESSGKKAAFLQTVARDLHLPVTVLARRIEDVVPTLAMTEIVTARALASLGQLLVWCEPLLKSGAIGLFPKGRDLDKELQEAAKCWAFRHEVFPSLVEPDSAILRLSEVARRG